MRRFVFSLKFEAKPEIEAENLEEAEAKARKMMQDVRVVRDVEEQIPGRRGMMGVCHTPMDAEEYERLEPRCLEEAEG